jgi:hypothetical protein
MAASVRGANPSWRGSVAALVLVASCSSRSAPQRDGASDAPAKPVVDAAARDVADAPKAAADVAAGDEAAAIVDGDARDGGVDAREGGRGAAPPVWSCAADGSVGGTDGFSLGATSCAALSSCGGDPTGQWFAGPNGRSACADISTGGCALADPTPGDACSAIVFQSGSPPSVGAVDLPFPLAPDVRAATLQLRASGDFTIDIDVTGRGAAHFAPACLVFNGHQSCTDLAVELGNVGPPPNGFACLPSADMGCDCSWTYGGAASPAIVAEVGTWRAEGNHLHLSAVSPKGGAQELDYTFCVNGGALALTATPGSVAFGPTTTPSGAHRFAVETLQLQRARGTVLHWNGTAWSTTALGGDLSPRAVAGSGPADVWAAGAFAGGSGAVGHWNGDSWSEEEVLPPGQDARKSVVVQRIWANTHDDAWAVGAAADGPAILRWNGAAWARFAVDVTGILPLDPIYGGGLGGIWGSGSNDVWVGAVDTAFRPILFRFDGTGWKQLPNALPKSDVPAGFPLSVPTGFSGTGSSDVWLVESGPPGRLAHWDGSAWTIKFVGNGTFQPLATWGSGPDDVWAVGAPGTTGQFVAGTGFVDAPASNVMHWDGKAWSAVESGTSARLVAVWGSGPKDVWAVGDKGTIVHWNGAVWSPVVSGTTDALLGIWGSRPDDIWVVMQ